MIKGIILDFDQTIADTSMIKMYRDLRKWDLVQNNIKKISIKSGFIPFYNYIRDNNILTYIVSRAPYEKYIKYALIYLEISVDFVIGYERGGHKKPSPEPMLLALKLMNIKANQCIAIGDEVSDTIAAKSAGIISVSLEDHDVYSDYHISSFEDCISIINSMKGDVSK